jgi:hypothetical protein
VPAVNTGIAAKRGPSSVAAALAAGKKQVEQAKQK